ncbi:MAG: RNase H family protein [Methanosarcinales archaeon]
MKIWVDGSGDLFEDNGRIAVVFENGKEIVKRIGGATNNEAEYLALIEALKYCKGKEEIFTDSQLLCGHLNMNWKVKAENLMVYYLTSLRLLKEKKVKLKWIPRSKNKAGILLDKLR